MPAASVKCDLRQIKPSKAMSSTAVRSFIIPRVCTALVSKHSTGWSREVWTRNADKDVFSSLNEGSSGCASHQMCSPRTTPDPASADGRSDLPEMQQQARCATTEMRHVQPKTIVFDKSLV